MWECFPCRWRQLRRPGVYVVRGVVVARRGREQVFTMIAGGGAVHVRLVIFDIILFACLVLSTLFEPRSFYFLDYVTCSYIYFETKVYPHLPSGQPSQVGVRTRGKGNIGPPFLCTKRVSYLALHL